MTEKAEIHWAGVSEAYVKAMSRYTLSAYNLERVAYLVANDCLAALEADILIKLRNLMRTA